MGLRSDLCEGSFAANGKNIFLFEAGFVIHKSMWTGHFCFEVFGVICPAGTADVMLIYTQVMHNLNS